MNTSELSNLGMSYSLPLWSGVPTPGTFFLECVRDGVELDPIKLEGKSHFFVGRDDTADIVVDNPLCSRRHAVFQFRNDDQLFIMDMGSTHGTFLNKQRIEPRQYVEISIGDFIRFANSSRLFFFRGPEPSEPSVPIQKLIKKDELASLVEAKLRSKSIAETAATDTGVDEPIDTESDLAFLESLRHAATLPVSEIEQAMLRTQREMSDPLRKMLEKRDHINRRIEALQSKITQHEAKSRNATDSALQSLQQQLESSQKTLEQSETEVQQITERVMLSLVSHDVKLQTRFVCRA